MTRGPRKGTVEGGCNTHNPGPRPPSAGGIRFLRNKRTRIGQKFAFHKINEPKRTGRSAFEKLTNTPESNKKFVNFGLFVNVRRTPLTKSGRCRCVLRAIGLKKTSQCNSLLALSLSSDQIYKIMNTINYWPSRALKSYDRGVLSVSQDLNNEWASKYCDYELRTPLSNSFSSRIQYTCIAHHCTHNNRSTKS